MFNVFQDMYGMESDVFILELELALLMFQEFKYVTLTIFGMDQNVFFQELLVQPVTLGQELIVFQPLLLINKLNIKLNIKLLTLHFINNIPHTKHNNNNNKLLLQLPIFVLQDIPTLMEFAQSTLIKLNFINVFLDILGMVLLVFFLLLDLLLVSHHAHQDMYGQDKLACLTQIQIT